MQTSYPQNQGVAVEGQFGTFSPGIVASCVAAVALSFGRFVSYKDGEENAVEQLVDADSPIAGCTILSHLEVNENSTAAEYKAGRPVSVLKFGDVYLKPETDVKQGQKVFVRHTAAGANTEIGRVRNDDDSGNAVEVNAKFVTSALADGLAIATLGY